MGDKTRSPTVRVTSGDMKGVNDENIVDQKGETIGNIKSKGNDTPFTIIPPGIGASITMEPEVQEQNNKT